MLAAVETKDKAAGLGVPMEGTLGLAEGDQPWLHLAASAGQCRLTQPPNWLSGLIEVDILVHNLSIPLLNFVSIIR